MVPCEGDILPGLRIKTSSRERSRLGERTARRQGRGRRMPKAGESWGTLSVGRGAVTGNVVKVRVRDCAFPSKCRAPVAQLRAGLGVLCLVGDKAESVITSFGN